MTRKDNHLKLISKYRDYYDFWARDRMFSDQSRVWERKTAAVPIGFAIPYTVIGGSRFIGNGIRDWRRDVEMTGFIVWFCGIPIPVVKVRRNSTSQTESFTTEFFYRIDEVPDDCHGGKPKRKSKYPTPYERLDALFSLGEGIDKTIGWRRNPFDALARHGRVMPKIDVLDMHRAVNSPVFCHAGIIDEHRQVEADDIGLTEIGLLKKECVLVNPRLASIEFWKKHDAFDAFQMVERFLSNELAPKDVRMDAPIPDKINAESHGFDKFSFRKQPTKRKG